MFLFGGLAPSFRLVAWAAAVGPCGVVREHGEQGQRLPSELAGFEELIFFMKHDELCADTISESISRRTSICGAPHVVQGGAVATRVGILRLKFVGLCPVVP